MTVPAGRAFFEQRATAIFALRSFFFCSEVELGRVPKKEEIDNVFLMALVMYKAVLGLHYQRQQQKKNGQLSLY
jgi:hypothetical protein